MMEWITQYWIEPAELKTLNFAEYWNDLDKEKDKKKWYVLDGDFSEMENYLQEKGMINEIDVCLDFIKKKYNTELSGCGMDLAAGSLWAIPHLFKSTSVQKMFCVEYSQHRLLNLGPKVLEHYGIPKEKVILCLGSFYELRQADQTQDFVFMSQAFHHADDPRALLSEINRVLKPGGFVIIVGEHLNNYALAYCKHFAKYILAKCVPWKLLSQLTSRPFKLKLNKFFPTTWELIPPDPVKGDHHYTKKQYLEMFEVHHFDVTHLVHKKYKTQSFVLRKPLEPSMQ